MLDKDSLVTILNKGILTLKSYQLILDYYFREDAMADWFGCVGNGGQYGTQDKYEYIFNYHKGDEKKYSLLTEDLPSRDDLEFLEYFEDGAVDNKRRDQGESTPEGG